MIYKIYLNIKTCLCIYSDLSFNNYIVRRDPLIFDDVEWKSVNSTANVPFRYLEISQNLRMIDEPFTTRVGFWKSIEKHLIKATMCDT